MAGYFLAETWHGGGVEKGPLKLPMILDITILLDSIFPILGEYLTGFFTWLWFKHIGTCSILNMRIWSEFFCFSFGTLFFDPWPYIWLLVKIYKSVFFSTCFVYTPLCYPRLPTFGLDQFALQKKRLSYRFPRDYAREFGDRDCPS